MAIKYTQWLKNIPNASEIDQMIIKFTNVLPKFTQIGTTYWFENIPSGNPDNNSKHKLCS
jgi:hypothetical protein